MASDEYDLQRVADYVQQHGFKRVTLQFPDDLLGIAASMAEQVQQALHQQGSPARVYVLADTSYNPLSIDEVAAAHVNADCIVHYGYASLHPVSRTPALCVLAKLQLDVQQCSTWLIQQLEALHRLPGSNSSSTGSSDSATQHQQQQAQQEQQGQQVCVLCCDQGYLHVLPQLQEAVQEAYKGPLHLVFAHSAPTELWPQGQCCNQLHSSSGGGGGSNDTAPAAAAGLNQAGGCCAGSSGGQQQQQLTAPADCAPNGATAASGAITGAATAQQPQAGEQQKVPVGGLLWQLPTGSSTSGRQQLPHMIWLGQAASPALTHLQLSHAAHPWLLLDPATHEVTQGLSPGLDRLLKRRYYLVERARGAAMVGLLVGTLGAANFKTALEQLRLLAAKAGKKTYTLLMGKPNPAKLANFPEVEVFVMLADPQGLILDSKDYLSPIITPHEAFLAFTGRDFDAAAYRLDFGDLLQMAAAAGDSQQQQQGRQRQPEGNGQPPAAVAADIGGNVTADYGGESSDGEEAGLAAAAGVLVIAGGNRHTLLGSSSSGSQAGSKQVQVRSAAQYLTQQRTYKGLETPAVGAEMLPAALAVEGRSGRAAGYVDEPDVSAS